MSYVLILHTHVEADISEAYNWYEDKQEGLGERFLAELVICYNKLHTQPEFFSKVERNYRKIIIAHFPYLIAYEVVKNSVFIYAVFHASRNPRKY